MKITEITKDGEIYFVTFTPNLIQTFFGSKEKIEQYKRTGDTYKHGGAFVYVNKLGQALGNYNEIGKAMDDWARRF